MLPRFKNVDAMPSSRLGRADSPSAPSVTKVTVTDYNPSYAVSLRFNADDMTCDITLKKVFQSPVAPCVRRGLLLFSSIYILFIYRCHNMSLRQQALLEGLSCMTLKNHPSSSVTAVPSVFVRSVLPSNHLTGVHS
jgi:hypothetical protein